MLFLILSVGLEPRVLKERNLVLAAAGYIVVSAYGPKEGIAKFVNSDFDVVVLCSSLGKDVSRLANAFRRFRPSIPLIVISGPRSEIQMEGICAVASNPDELLGAVHNMLAGRHCDSLSSHHAGANVSLPSPQKPASPRD